MTKYFKNYRTEGWGVPTEMCADLVFALDNLRHIAGKPIIVHCGYETTGHEENSYHYRGMAVDFHIVDTPILQQLFLATLIPEFGGIGVYPYWNHRGLHCDIRPRDYSTKMWMRKKDKTYKNLTNIYDIVYL